MTAVPIRAKAILVPVPPVIGRDRLLFTILKFESPFVSVITRPPFGISIPVSVNIFSSSSFIG